MMELNLTRLDYLQVCEAIFDRLPWIRNITVRLYQGLSKLF